jgi:hypothetical protein
MPQPGETRSDVADVFLHVVNRLCELAAGSAGESMLPEGPSMAGAALMSCSAARSLWVGGRHDSFSLPQPQRRPAGGPLHHLARLRTAQPSLATYRIV